MSILEVIVRDGGGTRSICVNPGNRELLDIALVARRDRSKATIPVWDPQCLDKVAEGYVQRGWFGKTSLVFPADSIVTARLID